MSPRSVLLTLAATLFVAIGSAHGESHGGSGTTGTATGQLVTPGTIVAAAGVLLAVSVLLYLLNETGRLDQLKARW